ncbi:MAG TPA: tRNA pseudouridine(38-40) synthase TruA [Nocardioidaceae bacterium]|nr:tRNA pseudouridine(38-40) synthase TruA [Nocardioidaceae bacterium]
MDSPGQLVRVRFDLAYDGSAFAGWAAQPGQRTVQGVLEAALGTSLGLADLRLTVAGRTDAGVHARGQVCHLDLPDEPAQPGRLDGLHHRLLRLLPADVVVRRVSVAPVGFDARFSAMWRRYSYRLCDDAAGADPLRRHLVLTWPRRLDVARMNHAAEALLGEHDFAAFCRRREGASTVRSLVELAWTREGSQITGRVVADAFCHTMVRSLVGCLTAVGEGRRDVGWPAAVLAAGVRDPAVLVVKPHGLTLEEVGYPPDDQLGARASAARRYRRSAT